MTQEQIEAIAFAMWNSARRGPGISQTYEPLKNESGAWMTYWEVYEVWLKAEDRSIYLHAAENMDPRMQKASMPSSIQGPTCKIRRDKLVTINEKDTTATEDSEEGL